MSMILLLAACSQAPKPSEAKHLPKEEVPELGHERPVHPTPAPTPLEQAPAPTLP